MSVPQICVLALLPDPASSPCDPTAARTCEEPRPRSERLGLGCTDWLLRPPGPLRAALPGVLDTPLAGVRGTLRAPECGVPGIGGESVGLTTPGELRMRSCARARTRASRRQRGGECAHQASAKGPQCARTSHRTASACLIDPLPYTVPARCRASGRAARARALNRAAQRRRGHDGYSKISHLPFLDECLFTEPVKKRGHDVTQEIPL